MSLETINTALAGAQYGTLKWFIAQEKHTSEKNRYLYQLWDYKKLHYLK